MSVFRGRRDVVGVLMGWTLNPAFSGERSQVRNSEFMMQIASNTLKLHTFLPFVA